MSEEIILETEELTGFFEEFRDVRNEVVKVEGKKRQALEKLASRLSSGESSTITRFIDDSKFRAEMLSVLSESSIYLLTFA